MGQDVCDVCDQPAALICSKCQDAVYCSERCQSYNYEEHKTICKAIHEYSDDSLDEEIAYFMEQPHHTDVALVASECTTSMWSRTDKEALLATALRAEHFDVDEIEFVGDRASRMLRKGKRLRFKSKVNKTKSEFKRGAAFGTLNPEKRAERRDEARRLKKKAKRQRKKARRLKRKARRLKRRKRKRKRKKGKK